MVKDALGKILHEGDKVHVSIGNPPTWVDGEIELIKMGGSIVPVSKTQQAIMAGAVIITFKAKAVFDPRNPVCLDIFKLEQEEKNGTPPDAA